MAVASIRVGHPDVVGQLVMAAEIGRMLGGLSRQRTYVVTTKPGFPEPLGVLRGGRVWDEDEVRAWIAAHRHEVTDEP